MRKHRPGPPTQGPLSGSVSRIDPLVLRKRIKQSFLSLVFLIAPEAGKRALKTARRCFGKPELPNRSKIFPVDTQPCRELFL
jgi:hypothetical protein